MYLPGRARLSSTYLHVECVGYDPVSFFLVRARFFLNQGRFHLDPDH